MIAQRTHGQDWLAEYVNRLVRLHRLIAAGQGDGETADAVRDEMDLSWRKMSKAEIERVRDLSVDLYTISDPPLEPMPLKEEFKSQINDALNEQRYDDALKLVRENAAQLDISAAAFLRGIGWSGLGLNAAAAEFFLHAEQQNPGMTDARLCALSTLITGNRENEALAPALRWASESDNPALVLKAAEVVFLNAVRLPDDQSAQHYQTAITLAERALKSYESASPKAESEQQIIVALLQIAVSYARLGNISKAREFCTQARTRSPDSLIAMMVDGMLAENAPPVSDTTQLAVVRQIGETLSGVSRPQDISAFSLN